MTELFAGPVKLDREGKMNTKAARIILVPAIFCVSLLAPVSLHAQSAAAAISGTVTGPSGGVVADAKVTVKNVATAQSIETQTNSAGSYSVAKLLPGDYQITIVAPGFETKTAQVKLAAGATQTLNVTLTSSLSLQDLGFSQSQTQGSAQEQARLNKRTHMLKIHQELGLITAIPLAATVISGAFAGGKTTSSSSRDLHAALGSVTAGLYFTTAYFAIRAPKIAGTKTRGPIRLHKAMAWIHGPGMILTPILGAMAYDQRSKGEKVHGIASYHGQVAIVTAAAYGIAILAVSVKPGFFSHSAHDALAVFGFRRSISADASSDENNGDISPAKAKHVKFVGSKP